MDPRPAPQNLHSPATDPAAAPLGSTERLPLVPIVFGKLYFNRGLIPSYVQAVIERCEFCGRRHTYGAGPLNTPIARDLGERRACHRAPFSDWRIIISDPLHIVGHIPSGGGRLVRYLKPVEVQS